MYLFVYMYIFMYVSTDGRRISHHVCTYMYIYTVYKCIHVHICIYVYVYVCSADGRRISRSYQSWHFLRLSPSIQWPTSLSIHSARLQRTRNSVYRGNRAFVSHTHRSRITHDTSLEKIKSPSPSPPPSAAPLTHYNSPGVQGIETEPKNYRVNLVFLVCIRIYRGRPK